MTEELVVINTVGKVSALIEIREPGSTRFNNSGMLIAVRKIECSVENARELYRQLGERIEQYDNAAFTE